MIKNLLRASSLYRDKNCLANRQMGERAAQLGQAPPESTPDTERGDRVHAGEPATLDEKDAHTSMVQESYRIFDQIAQGEPYKVEIEKELFLRFDGLIPYFSGHPDRFIQLPGRLAWVDFKPGYEADWPAWEAQMDGYAALLCEHFGAPAIELVGTIITRYHGNREYRYTPETVEGIIEEIQDLEALYSPLIHESKTTPGPWCKYCQGRLICKDALTTLPEIVEVPFAQYLLPKGSLGAEVLTKLKLIEKIAKERIKWYEEQVAKDPNYLGGLWVIGKGRQMPKIDDAHGAMLELVDKGVITIDDIYQCITLSAAKAREIVQEKHKLSKADAAKKVAMALGEFLRYETTAGSLVPKEENKLKE